MIRIVLFLALCAIIDKSNGEDIPGHVQYLIKYGYLESLEEGGPPSSFSDEEIDSALKTAQKFAGIPETGKLDNKTLKMLAAPRCGFPDTGSKVKRFIADGSKWRTRHLTYGFLNFSHKLNPQQIKNTLRKAFSSWAQASGLRFSLTDERMSNIKIGFYSGDHGDGFPFDGPSHVLAHAFFPQDGRLHFDEDEEWTAERAFYIEFSLLAVATHELGHALGLRHSYVPGAIMKPIYSPQTHLGSDDIRGIQSLYGRQRM